MAVTERAKKIIATEVSKGMTMEAIATKYAKIVKITQSYAYHHSPHSSDSLTVEEIGALADFSVLCRMVRDMAKYKAAI